MSKHDFSALYDQYPSIIAEMDETFTSHEFILLLAHQHQKLYVEALYSYRDSLYDEKPVPFRPVHQMLGRGLARHKDLVTRIGDTPSEDIFRNSGECSEWKKL
jgi:hypothetical protein